MIPFESTKDAEKTAIKAERALFRARASGQFVPGKERNHLLGLMRPPLASKPETIRRHGTPVKRNEPCPCGSGKKYKNCCLKVGRRFLKVSSANLS